MSGIVVGPRAYATSAEAVRFVGQLYLFGTGTNSHILTLSKTIMLRGGNYWVSNPTIGDRISLSVVDNHLSEVSVYCEQIPVPPFAGLHSIESPTIGLIPAGYSLKVTYSNNGNVPVDLGLTYSWFEV